MQGVGQDRSRCPRLISAARAKLLPMFRGMANAFATSAGKAATELPAATANVQKSLSALALLCGSSKSSEASTVKKSSSDLSAVAAAPGEVELVATIPAEEESFPTVQASAAQVSFNRFSIMVLFTRDIQQKQKFIWTCFMDGMKDGEYNTKQLWLFITLYRVPALWRDLGQCRKGNPMERRLAIDAHFWQLFLDIVALLKAVFVCATLIYSIAFLTDDTDGIFTVSIFLPHSPTLTHSLSLALFLSDNQRVYVRYRHFPFVQSPASSR